MAPRAAAWRRLVSMLARMAQFDLAAAERVHGRLMAAEEPCKIAKSSKGAPISGWR